MNPWHANLLRELAIGNARTPEDMRAAQAMPVYPLPPTDIVWGLQRHIKNLESELRWAHGEIDHLHAENEALRREIRALLRPA